MNFSIMIRKSLEMCSSLQATKKLEKEFQNYNLKIDTLREKFDPYHHVRVAGGRNFRHQMHLEG